MDEHTRKLLKVFMWTFIVVEGLFVLLCLSVGFGEDAIMIPISVGISLIVALFIMVCYAAARRGAQIGEIIEAKHKEIRQKALKSKK